MCSRCVRFNAARWSRGNQDIRIEALVLKHRNPCDPRIGTDLAGTSLPDPLRIPRPTCSACRQSPQTVHASASCKRYAPNRGRAWYVSGFTRRAAAACRSYRCARAFARASPGSHSCIARVLPVAHPRLQCRLTPTDCFMPRPIIRHTPSDAQKRATRTRAHQIRIIGGE